MNSIRQPHRQAYQFPDRNSTDPTNDPQPIKLLAKLRTTTPVNGQEGTAQPIPPQPPPEPPAPRRNLPGPIIDLIRGGTTRRQLKDGGAKAIRTALLRTANSAVNNNWQHEEWAALIDEEASGLGHQLKLSGKNGREIKRQQFHRTLRHLWDDAERWVASRPPAYTHQQIQEELDRIRRASSDSGLGPTDRTILTTAINIAEANGTTRPALPRRLLMESSGIGERATRNSLVRLEKAGWLELALPGRSGKPEEGKAGEANLYRLAVPTAMEARKPDPVNGVCGTPPPMEGGRIYGTPPIKENSEMGPPHLKNQESGEGSVGPPHSGKPPSRARAIYEQWLTRQIASASMSSSPASGPITSDTREQ